MIVEKLDKIIEVCNSGELLACQQPGLVLSLAQILKKYVHNQEEESNNLKSACKNYLDFQIDLIKQLIQKKLQGLQNFDNKIQKLNQITKNEFDASLDLLYTKISEQTLLKIGDLNKQINTLKLNKSNNGSIINQGQVEPLNRLIEKTQNKMNQQLSTLSKRCKDIQQDLNYLFRIKVEKKPQANENIANVKKQKNQQKTPNIDVAKQWVDNKCWYFKQLILESNVITNKLDGPVHIFGRHKNMTKFSFAIVFTKLTGLASIGVIDSSLYRETYSSSMLNKIQYWTDGLCLIGQRKQGQTNHIKKGQQIRVQVNLQVGTIKWKSGQKIKLQKSLQILRNNKIKWVPYIRFQYQNDSAKLFK